jgi:CBS domain-containing protein
MRIAAPANKPHGFRRDLYELRNMKVKDFMTPAPVYSCGQDTSLPEAASMMKEANCGMLPVLSRNNKVIGIITDRDICLALAGTYGRDLYNRRIGDICDGEVYSVDPEHEMEDALRIMRTRKVNRLPVMDEEGRLAGILSVNDMLLRVVELAGEGRRADTGDGGEETLYSTLGFLVRRDSSIPDLGQRNNENSFEVI